MNTKAKLGWCVYRPRNAKVASKLAEAKRWAQKTFCFIVNRRNQPTETLISDFTSRTVRKTISVV